jgi:PAS domain S-box-containing protein
MTGYEPECGNGMDEKQILLALSNSDDVGVWEWDLKSDVITVKGSLRGRYDTVGDTLSGPSAEVLSRIMEEDAGVLQSAVQKAIETGEQFSVVYRVLRPDGTTVFSNTQGRCTFGANGEAVSVSGITVDVTAQKAAERALTESEERFRAMTNAIDQMVWSTTADGLYDFYNDRWYDFTGMPRKSAVGREWHQVLHPDDRASAQAAWQKSLRTGDPYDFQYRLKHHIGHYRWVAARAQPTQDSSGKIVRWYGSCTDIHEIKLEEHRRRFLLDLNDQLRSTSSALDATMTASRAIGEFINVPRVGYGDIDGTGETVTVERDWTTGEAFSLAGESRILDGFGPAVIEVLKAGETLVVTDCYQDARAGDRFAPTWDSIGCRALIVVPILRAGLLKAIFYLHDPKPRKWTKEDIALAEDVTQRTFAYVERLRAEQEILKLNATLELRVADEVAERTRAQDQLRQAQKMEALGNLTGGVAHDFNNLLHVVSGNLQLLTKEVAGNEKAERRISHALAGVNRGSKLASQLLAFGRRQALDPRPVNIGRLVRGMDELLQRSIGEGIEIETIVSGGLWNSFVDPTQIENALLNLAINARDAMDGSGKLTIEVGNANIDDTYARRHEDVRPGQYVALFVTDTGSGMSPELLTKVFEPFFSTKPVGKGSGLGLSMVYGFAKQTGGHVQIYSEVGQGTTVRMYLPRSMHEEAVEVERSDLPIVGGHETILVAEDDEGVRATVVEMLQELGYRVLKAADAAAALQVIESGVAIDLLFTDVVMPGPLKSVELARRAQERTPSIKVLFTSGYTENSIVHGGRLDDGVKLLSKPYTREQLAHKIRQSLDDRQQEIPHSRATNAQRTVTDPAAPSANKLKILVVEDDVLIRMSIIDMLDEIGHSSIETGSAEEALQVLERETIDVLLTDLGLPGMSGEIFARHVRQRWPKLSIVFATGMNKAPLLDNNSHTALLEKPFGTDNVRAAIDQSRV